MPEREGERLAALEVAVQGMRGDVSRLFSETLRTRGRLHELEGTTSALVLAQRERIRRDRERDTRLNRRIQLLTLVIGAAAVVAPLVSLRYH